MLGLGLGITSVPLLGRRVSPPGAPTLSWASTSSDATPDFDVTLPADAQAGDVLRIEDSTDGTNYTTYLTYVLQAADITAGSITGTASADPVADASYTFRARLERDGAPGAYSATVAVTISTGFTDNFNRADENLEANANWTRIDGVVGAIGVRSNQLGLLSTTVTAYSCPDLGSADMFAQFTLKTISTTGPGAVAVRLQNGSNYIGVRNTSAFLQVLRVVGGATTQVGSLVACAINDVVRLEVTGDNVRVLQNGVEVIAPTALGGAGAGITKAGVVARSNLANPWIDDFSAGVL